ncbi:heme ABC transporter ATP-binding protein [Lutispora saccharofermentans]|uniref:Heme ABC transporter ATP-binding protein n=1 Tax=Lutispora saccharofermentans TaxID=3024236 RepID=A0ABT1NBN2_9FIRM|nr:heme ABC transporter ATP-binding protein [Lutispora saccharofermentans]MCQ1528444.1 heme ABC transporter ATP-binding protein [Lutispora saccharofermentans]
MDYEISAEHLGFCYGNKEVLKNINLKIKEGSFISIIGPNGSGKSTLLKTLSGFLKPQRGAVLIGEENLKELSQREISKRLSMVPQNILLEFDFKVKDIVLMGRHPYIKRLKGETPEDIKIVEKAMRYTNILEFSDRLYNELSGGEKQRVILAQALAQQPRVLLLDEPISHLDLQHQVEILDLIKRMSMEEGLASIAVLHDLNMASAYSDHIVMLKAGEIFCEGEPEKVLTAENIAHVFNTDVTVSKNPVTGKTYIYPISTIPKKKRDTKIHIICGGGSGSKLIKELADNGFTVSTGVLNIGDSDWAASKEYELDVAEETPFLNITQKAYEKNLELALAAYCIVLMPIYFSKANIRNLELLTEKQLKDKKIYILGDRDFEKRDYTGGEARSLYKGLKKQLNVIQLEEYELIEALLKADEGNE